MNFFATFVGVFAFFVSIKDTNGDCDTLASDEDGTIVELPDYGCLRGVMHPTKMGRKFTSIPYAKPPIVDNDLRFRNPVKHDSWDGIRNATEVAPACMQDCSATSVACYKEYTTMSEDCLYLNVNTPWPLNESIINDSNGYPVMLFIHGGSYLDGWSGSVMYESFNLAVMNNIITISINYRMGAFGYFYDEDLGFDGNYGYYDQLFAIEWAYNNIEYFGGNKNNIVLFGESAGAMSVGTILMNYNETTQTNVSKMYTGAIMESNPLGLPFRRTDTWEAVGEAFVLLTDCFDKDDPAECLRSDKTSDELLSAQSSAKDFGECTLTSCSFLEFFAPWTPTFGTDILPQQQPLFGFENGEYNKDVPIMIGTNRNEAILFIYSFLSSSLDCIEYDIALGLLFDSFGKTEKIIDKYSNDAPSDCSHDHREIAAEIFTDFLFKCPTRYSSVFASDTTNDNIYVYNYDYYYTYSSLWYTTVTECANGNYICHAAEMPCVFHPTSQGFNYTQNDLKLSLIMQQYWTNVAKIGKPGTSNGLEWPPFVDDTQLSMVFNKSGQNQIGEFVADDTSKCEFWDELHYFWLKDNNDMALKIYGNCNISFLILPLLLSFVGVWL